jgi:hypothetical protein
MIIEAKPTRVGKTAFRLRWAKDKLLTITNVNTGNNQVTTANNELQTADPVWVVSDNTLPAATLAPNTKYFWIRVNATTGKFALTKADANANNAIALTSAGAGTHYIMYASAQAAADYGTLVVRAGVNGEENERIKRLKKAGITQKIDSSADSSDDDIVDVDGNELSVVFDNDSANQTALGGRTVMVIPTEPDLSYLWQVEKIFENRKKITNDDYSELGSYLLKKCR